MTLFIRQHLNPANAALSYLLVDAVTRSAALIDGFDDCLESYCKQVSGLNVDLRFLLYTRECDHAGDSWQQLQARTGARLVHGCQQDKQEAVLYLGEAVVRMVATPGYSPGARVFQANNLVFTGLTLLAGGLPNQVEASDAEQWYRSVHDYLYQLPDDYLVYPGRLHGCRRVSCIAEEKACNELLTVDCDATRFYRRLKSTNPSATPAH